MSSPFQLPSRLPDYCEPTTITESDPRHPRNLTTEQIAAMSDEEWIATLSNSECRGGSKMSYIEGTGFSFANQASTYYCFAGSEPEDREGAAIVDDSDDDGFYWYVYTDFRAAAIARKRDICKGYEGTP